VGAVDLSHHRFRRPPVEMDFAGLTHADHSFIAADRPGVSIECPVTALKDWNEIWTHELNPCSLGDGWLLPGSWGSNAFGTRAQVQIEIGDEIPHTLALRLRASGTLGENVEQSIRILVNGRDIGEHPVSRKWHAIRQAIPTGVLVSGRNQITLDFAHATSHRQADSGKDSRAIAATVDRMAFLITSGSAGSPSDETATTSVWDDQLQSFAIGQSGALVLPLLIPRGAHEIEFELQPSRSVDLSSAKVVLASEDLDGGNRRQASMDGRLIRDRGRIGLPVTDLAGRWALVTIDVSIDGGQLAISAPRIVSGADVPTHEPSSPFVPSAVESLPDIVLITLDAARGDRLSSAGYSRKTTPFIDRIARESLVFKNAFALAPYTLCSVPTMITGLSPLDHGVVYHEDVLSPDAVTLAESLQSRGYLTVAFSATPNNSKSKGFAQGYDVFREIWKEKPGKVSRRAHFAAKRVVEWLDTIEDDRPLHLQVHLIPPHAPYDPPDRFDLFTDPFYDGPCDGYNQTISTVDGREVPATPECIEHLNNLYDGNLRTADDAARIVINALRQRPRWKDTVVLITSDHGEAFWDHKMLGHNSSVYKEMLHVPFVLRLPPTHRDHTIDTNRLVTLADIVPTLLGTAGITTEGGDGVDLLDPTTEAQGRYMIARTTEKRPFWGLRTLRWSLMVNSAGSGALFDLSTDPDELDNIWGSQSATAAGLGRIFSRRIGLPPRLTAANESAEITENDRDLLEALGYVND
jgi:arylsulfatase